MKRYSSGMQMRLAFAVAAHLDPDILILDEVLTVGDLDFQQKCLERVERLVSEGRTLLFVSHSLESLAKILRSLHLAGRRQGPRRRPDPGDPGRVPPEPGLDGARAAGRRRADPDAVASRRPGRSDPAERAPSPDAARGLV